MAFFPLCSHDLIRWDGDKPIIDADAVNRFASHLAQTDTALNGGVDWPSQPCREEAWRQAHRQLALVKDYSEADLEELIERTDGWLDNYGVRDVGVLSTAARRERHDELMYSINAYRRALAFKVAKRTADQAKRWRQFLADLHECESAREVRCLQDNYRSCEFQRWTPGAIDAATSALTAKLAEFSRGDALMVTLADSLEMEAANAA